MAETTGLVQQMFVGQGLCCVWIGPTPNNSEVLWVLSGGSSQEAAFGGTLVEILATASTNYRAVAAIHGDADARITALRIDPV